MSRGKPLHQPFPFSSERILPGLGKIFVSEIRSNQTFLFEIYNDVVLLNEKKRESRF